MFKHVGLHNAQKVVIILPKMLAPDDHMTLVVYQDKLPPRYFEAVMKALGSAEGQASKSFADVLEHTNLDETRNLARVLYTEGHLKKVPSNQVFATPYGYESSNKIKLNELNDYLEQIEKGGDALKKLEQIEEGKGLHRKKKLPEAKVNPIPSSPTPTLPIAKTEAPAARPLPAQVPVPHLSADPQTASNELKSHSDALKTVAAQLLHQAKLFAEKAEMLYPTQQKRGRGRPKGTGLKVVTKTK